MNLPFIWRSGSESLPPNTWTYFRKRFEWDNAMPSTILFAADPTARLWINGALVRPRVMRFVTPQITVEEIDLAPYLRDGSNTAVILHHWWGVPTFQRSRGGTPGIAVQSDFLATDEEWHWRNADEFLAHPHQTLGGGTRRIRFPVVMDARLEDASLHDCTWDPRKWSPAVPLSSSAWSQPVLKETDALERKEVFPFKVEAVGTVTPPRGADSPYPEASMSWLASIRTMRGIGAGPNGPETPWQVFCPGLTVMLHWILGNRFTAICALKSQTRRPARFWISPTGRSAMTYALRNQCSSQTGPSIPSSLSGHPSATASFYVKVRRRSKFLRNGLGVG